MVARRPRNRRHAGDEIAICVGLPARTPLMQGVPALPLGLLPDEIAVSVAAGCPFRGHRRTDSHAVSSPVRALPPNIPAPVRPPVESTSHGLRLRSRAPSLW